MREHFLCHTQTMKTKLLIFGIFIVIFLVAYQKYSEFSALKSIDSYDVCVDAKGSKIQESYPATCITRLGKSFAETTPTQSLSPSILPTVLASPISTESKIFTHTLTSEENGNPNNINYSLVYPSNLTIQEQAAGTYAFLTEPNNLEAIAFYVDERQIEIIPFKNSQEKTFLSKNGQIRIICFKDYCSTPAYKLILSTFKFTN